MPRTILTNSLLQFSFAVASRKWICCRTVFIEKEGAQLALFSSRFERSMRGKTFDVGIREGEVVMMGDSTGADSEGPKSDSREEVTIGGAADAEDCCTGVPIG